MRTPNTVFFSRLILNVLHHIANILLDEKQNQGLEFKKFLRYFPCNFDVSVTGCD